MSDDDSGSVNYLIYATEGDFMMIIGVVDSLVGASYAGKLTMDAWPGCEVFVMREEEDA